MQHRILSFDIGRNMGYAGHPPQGHDEPGQPIHGVFQLPPSDDGEMGPMFRALYGRTIELIFAQPVQLRTNSLGQMAGYDLNGARVQPQYTMMIYEAAIPFGGRHGSSTQTNIFTIEQQLGRGAMIELAAAQFGLQVYKGHIQKIRKHFCGNGRPEKPKDAVMQACREIGWYPQDDNAADALAQFDYACHMVEQPFRRAAGALFLEKTTW